MTWQPNEKAKATGTLSCLGRPVESLSSQTLRCHLRQGLTSGLHGAWRLCLNCLSPLLYVSQSQAAPGSGRRPRSLKLTLRTSQSRRPTGREGAGRRGGQGWREGPRPMFGWWLRLPPRLAKAPGMRGGGGGDGDDSSRYSARRAQLGSRLQHGGGRAALRPAGRWDAVGPDQWDSEAGGSGEQAELGLTWCAPVLACSLQEAPRL